MLLTDLLDLPVHDHNGDRVGWVCDIRFRIPARPAASDRGGVASPEVVGILLSPRRRGSYLGFERTDVHAPVLLARWIRWRHRGTCLVPWSDVDHVEDGAVVLDAQYRRESPLLSR